MVRKLLSVTAAVAAVVVVRKLLSVTVAVAAVVGQYHDTDRRWLRGDQGMGQ